MVIRIIINTFLKLTVMRTKRILKFILITGFALVYLGCSGDDNGGGGETPAPATFTLVSLTADGIDLAGVSAATDVPEGANIVAVFSSDVDAATATAANLGVSNTDTSASADYAVSASGATVTLTPNGGWDAGTQFNIELSSGLAGSNGTKFAGNSLSFRTSGIFVPQNANQVLYLSFDGESTADEAGSNTVSTVQTLNFTEDRRGTANAAAFFDGTGNLVEVAANAELISPSTTISYWFKTDVVDYNGQDGSGSPQTRFLMGLGVEKGYLLEIGRRSNDPGADGYNEFFLKYATNHVNIGENGTAVPKATAWTELNSQITVNFDAAAQSGWSYALDQLQEDPPNRSYLGSEVMGKWTHLVMTVDAAAQTKTLYINGVKWASFQWISSGADWLFTDLSLKTENNDGSPIEGLEGSLALGFAGSSTNTATGWADHATTLTNPAEGQKFFKGGIDQFRIFNVALTDAEVQTLYDNEQ